MELNRTNRASLYVVTTVVGGRQFQRFDLSRSSWRRGAGLVRSKTGDVRGQRKLVRLAGGQTKVKAISADNSRGLRCTIFYLEAVCVNIYVCCGVAAAARRI